METVGSEVGYKMRSAIKAKLNELGCYVDDELPDYVMVMVANKRSRTQMEDDLQLFLGTKTEIFVHWLHQVLQKLQEVKIPPPAPKETLSHQSSTDSSVSIKKEKKDKKHKKTRKEEKSRKTIEKPAGLKTEQNAGSDIKITDVLANQLLETVKSKANLLDENTKVETNQTKPDTVVSKPLEKDTHPVDDFDIPTISEIEKESSKISEQLSNVKAVDKNVGKTRQKIEFMKSDSDDDVLHLSNDNVELGEESPRSTRNMETKVTEIISTTPPKKEVTQRSIQRNPKIDPLAQNRVKDILLSNMIDKSKRNRSLPSVVENKPERSNIRSRLGARVNNESNNRLSSKIVAISSTISNEDDVPPVSLSSIVKVKPRPQLPPGLQANRNLLLKAMADAQKSIAQVVAKPVRKPLELYTKRFRIDGHKKINYGPKSDIRITVGNDCRNLPVDEDSMEYTPAPVLNDSIESTSSFQEYIPSQINSYDAGNDDIEMEDEINLFPTADDKKMLSPQFVVTLEGLDTSKFPSRKRKMVSTSTPIIAKESKSEISVSKIPEKHKHTLLFITEKILKMMIVQKMKEKGVKLEKTIDLTTLSDTSPILDKTIEDSDKEIMERVNDTVKIIINDKAIGEQRMQSNSGETKVKLKEIQCKYDHIPDALPEVAKKERCKYYPSCRLGSSCEFLHPPSASSNSLTCTVPCKAFPNCKFGSSCLYLHPRCKFGADCIKKRDCIYNHSGSNSIYNSSIENGGSVPTLSSTVSVVSTNSTLSSSYKTSGVICRFHPMCSNMKCTFYHPKMCRFGKYCNNRAECNFYHQETINKEKFVWKPAATTI
ncbi:LOW QUALITY PROTEIN: zinc finger CCCH domain-containing protein 14 [Ctenocephalides felis]|uniref:LOW QUALITY PROTEIN: zinc finger CCCH domain-containing protein 14 n=1 Tax=Ctenocephalides felis TaxID=7515 RepID=UPI000E6E218A|nr:LOW QUALITY PROTEIN: zinc finger CCCH domain-containing protein 14 [Ctenocephalides felis]